MAKGGRVPAAVINLAGEAREELIPVKSRDRYLRALKLFNMWQVENDCVNNYEEDVVLAFVKCFCDKNSVSTAWATYSMIKKVLQITEDVNIEFASVNNFLKVRTRSYTPKQAKVFTNYEVAEFLLDAPDEVYLGIKVIFALGVLGTMRCHELATLMFDDVKDIGEEIFLVKIRKSNSKNDIPRSFTMSDYFYGLLKNYVNLRPANPSSNHFLMHFYGGKCTRQNVGKNTIAKVPMKVAKFLKLEDVASYTGHSMRRTSATFISNGGGDLLTLKRQGGWKSSTVAEKYVDQSLFQKKKAESMIKSVLKEGIGERSVENNLWGNVELKRKNFDNSGVSSKSPRMGRRNGDLPSVKKNNSLELRDFNMDFKGFSQCSLVSPKLQKKNGDSVKIQETKSVECSNFDIGNLFENELSQKFDENLDFGRSDSGDFGLTTYVADGCKDLLNLEREGGCKSSAVGEKYADESLYEKKKAESMLKSVLKKGIGESSVEKKFVENPDLDVGLGDFFDNGMSEDIDENFYVGSCSSGGVGGENVDSDDDWPVTPVVNDGKKYKSVFNSGVEDRFQESCSDEDDVDKGRCVKRVGTGKVKNDLKCCINASNCIFYLTK